MAHAKGLKHLKADSTEFAKGQRVHDFLTSRKAVIVDVHQSRKGSRPMYEIRFVDQHNHQVSEDTAKRLRDDLDAA